MYILSPDQKVHTITQPVKELRICSSIVPTRVSQARSRLSMVGSTTVPLLRSTSGNDGREDDARWSASAGPFGPVWGAQTRFRLRTQRSELLDRRPNQICVHPTGPGAAMELRAPWSRAVRAADAGAQ